jgi:hypothetical protein
MAENKRVVTVHVRQCSADLRRCDCLPPSFRVMRREAEKEPHTSVVTGLRACLLAVRLQPGLELSRFIVQNDPVQETAP